jgi:hypothetical protein
MLLTVKFFKEDHSNARVYYQGMGNAHGHTYCVQDGMWHLCSWDKEPQSPLMAGTEITIYDSTGIIGNTVIKKENQVINTQ